MSTMDISIVDFQPCHSKGVVILVPVSTKSFVIHKIPIAWQIAILRSRDFRA